jgi:hypothetical protein
MFTPDLPREVMSSHVKTGLATHFCEGGVIPPHPTTKKSNRVTPLSLIRAGGG